MSDIAIQVENLSKRYRLGASEHYRMFRDAMVQALAAPFRRLREGPSDDERTLWALRDVSFQVNRGEVVGIVGHNGAGKSTLLKILSRITEPTTGQAVIHGRLGSLLEVGTGFHQELTGRENIYLNGAILGMRKAEIDRNFDAIVAFAELDRFIDTPVKRYSTGMYMRLAFAVAAHLEPEVLVVDEVLAVGDMAFQKKCLGKMDEVARHGRTILFVSHNMGAVQSLCPKTLWLQRGQVMEIGPTQQVLARYMAAAMQRSQEPLDRRSDRQGNGSVRFTSASIQNLDGGSVITAGSRIKLTLEYHSPSGKPILNPRVYASIHDDQSHTAMFVFDSECGAQLPDALPASGTLTCITDPIRVTPGRCYVNIGIYRGGDVADHLDQAISFDVEPDDSSPSGRFPERRWAFTLIAHRWEIQEKLV